MSHPIYRNYHRLIQMIYRKKKRSLNQTPSLTRGDCREQMPVEAPPDYYDNHTSNDNSVTGHLYFDSLTCPRAKF